MALAKGTRHIGMCRYEGGLTQNGPGGGGGAGAMGPRHMVMARYDGAQTHTGPLRVRAGGRFTDGYFVAYGFVVQSV